MEPVSNQVLVQTQEEFTPRAELDTVVHFPNHRRVIQERIPICHGFMKTQQELQNIPLSPVSGDHWEQDPN